METKQIDKMEKENKKMKMEINDLKPLVPLVNKIMGRLKGVAVPLAAKAYLETFLKQVRLHYDYGDGCFYHGYEKSPWTQSITKGKFMKFITLLFVRIVPEFRGLTEEEFETYQNFPKIVFQGQGENGKVLKWFLLEVLSIFLRNAPFDEFDDYGKQLKLRNEIAHNGDCLNVLYKSQPAEELFFADEDVLDSFYKKIEKELETHIRKEEVREDLDEQVSEFVKLGFEMMNITNQGGALDVEKEIKNILSTRIKE